MPFQVTFNSTQVGLAPITLISAGEDRNVSCGIVVNLEGIVDIPENVAGHVILWEQLSGVPITLTSLNTLVTAYSFTERSDKTFRLWLDKSTAYAQFKDISIFHTPKSVATMYLGGSVSVRSLPIADIVDCGTISSTLEFVLGAPELGQEDRTPCQLDGGVPTSGVLFDFGVSWTVPNTKLEMIPYFLDTQLFYADSDTVASPRYVNLPGTVVAHHFFPGGENELRRFYILSRYNIAGEIITIQSCVVDYTDIAIPGIHVIDDNPVAHVLGNSLTQIINYGNISLVNISAIAPLALADSKVTVTNYSNISEMGVSIIGPLTLSNSTINITRFDPTGIGN